MEEGNITQQMYLRENYPQRWHPMIWFAFCGPLGDGDMQPQLIFLGSVHLAPCRQGRHSELDISPPVCLLCGCIYKSTLIAVTNNGRISVPDMAEVFLAHTAVQCGCWKSRRNLFHAVIQGPSSLLLKAPPFLWASKSVSGSSASSWLICEERKHGGLCENGQRPGFWVRCLIIAHSFGQPQSLGHDHLQVSLGKESSWGPRRRGYWWAPPISVTEANWYFDNQD